MRICPQAWVLAAMVAILVGGVATARADTATTVIRFSDLLGMGVHNGDLLPAGFGGTSLVSVTYATPGLDPNHIGFWTAGFGDLYGVAIPNTQTASDTNPVMITLTPAAGHFLTLNSFDIAGYGGDFTSTSPSDLYVEVLSGDTVVWSYTGQVSLTGHTTFAPGIDGFGPTSILFGPMGSSASWDFGITNISYTDPDIVPTPEPSSLLLLGTGLVSLAGAVRSRIRK